MKRIIFNHYVIVLFASFVIHWQLYRWLLVRLDTSTFIRADLNVAEGFLIDIVMTIIFAVISVLPLLIPVSLLHQRVIRICAFFSLPVLALVLILCLVGLPPNAFHWQDMLYPSVFLTMQLLSYIKLAMDKTFDPAPSH